MNIWFTADYHLGHENIIKYCNRPFSTVEEMDAELIHRHNEVVRPDDTVYIIGDFTLGGHDIAVRYLERLNGRIILQQGSHDSRWFDRDLGDGRISTIPPLHSLELPIQKGEYKQIVVLCHYAMRSWDRSHYGSWHLFGHSHGKLEPYGLSFDVGVDTHNFYPWSLEEVAEKMATLSPIVDYSKQKRG